MGTENKTAFWLLLWLGWQSDQRKLLTDFTIVAKTRFFWSDSRISFL